MHKIKRKGFTLAELLFTLAVIGVVASLTIPDLVTSIQKQQYVSGYKTANQILSAATEQIIADNNGNLLNKYADSYTLMRAYATKMNIAKTCLSGVWGASQQCWAEDSVWNLTNTNLFNHFTSGAAIILSNGMALYTENNFWDSACSTYNGWNVPGLCGELFVDINGNSKRPNILGLDVFAFYIYAQAGLSPEINNNLPTYFCTTHHGDESLGDDTYNDRSNGISCGARIMTQGEMNY